jgi:DNA-binding FrmR family transcriptional regulator
MPEPVQLTVLGPVMEKIRTHLASDVERDLDARLASIEGHVCSVRRMLAEQRDCDEILIQMAAVKAAMNQTTIKLLEQYIETCMTTYVDATQEAEDLARLKRALSTMLKNT